MTEIKRFDKRICSNGERYFIHTREDINELTKFCNMLAEKVDELVQENNRLSREIDRLKGTKNW